MKTKPPSWNAICDRIEAMIARIQGIPESQIPDLIRIDTSLGDTQDGLGFDVPGRRDLAIRLNEEFGIHLTKDQTQAAEKVSDLADLVQAAVS